MRNIIDWLYIRRKGAEMSIRCTKFLAFIGVLTKEIHILVTMSTFGKAIDRSVPKQSTRIQPNMYLC